MTAAARSPTIVSNLFVVMRPPRRHVTDERAPSRRGTVPVKRAREVSGLRASKRMQTSGRTSQSELRAAPDACYAVMRDGCPGVG